MSEHVREMEAGGKERNERKQTEKDRERQERE